MEKNFWLDKWKVRDIGFHASVVHPLLAKYLPELSLPSGSRVFLPLCGKTRDIHWLLSQGLRVVGIELSEIAVKELFEELEVEPKISSVGALKLYQTKDLDVFVGDFFELTPEFLGSVDAVYDRAAIVALPLPLRERYSAHLVGLTHSSPQLLITFDYDQTKMEGPPFSVTDEEVRRHYSGQFVITLLESATVEGGLKGRVSAREKIWLLRKR